MPDGHGTVTAPPEPGTLHHLDWDRAVTNHQSEEKLRAFLAEYPADLRRIVADMREALESKDTEKLRDAAQKVMGSSSYVAATQLHDRSRLLVEAIDLDEDHKDLAQQTAAEAEELEREIIALTPVAQADTTPADAAKGPACCSLQ
mmetsp:Transcript_114279/g.210027  ORF Transcript_114279/g.210027 Transcript_114279/m.210027 type:complete len:146 (-) Transcript_114279:25-462(-)